jgi:preprotein translocase subunit SecG
MLALIDYGLIVVFFLGVLALVLVVARPRADEIADQKSAAPSAVLTEEEKKLSYVVIAVFFLLLVLGAFISAKGQTHASSHSI